MYNRYYGNHVLKRALSKEEKLEVAKGLKPISNFCNLGVEAISEKKMNIILACAKHTDLNNARVVRPKQISKIHCCFVFSGNKASINNILDSMTCKAKGG